MKFSELVQALEQIKEPKQLSFSWGKINDHNLFIENHVSFLRSNSGKTRFMPYYNRLIEFYKSNK